MRPQDDPRADVRPLDDEPEDDRPNAWSGDDGQPHTTAERRALRHAAEELVGACGG